MTRISKPVTSTSTTNTNSLNRDDVLAREDDLDFLAALRAANLRLLCQLKTNLRYGGAPWMRVAVERAIARACPATAARM
jgi:hypothetical protein